MSILIHCRRETQMLRDVEIGGIDTNKIDPDYEIRAGYYALFACIVNPKLKASDARIIMGLSTGNIEEDE